MLLKFCAVGDFDLQKTFGKIVMHEKWMNNQNIRK